MGDVTKRRHVLIDNKVQRHYLRVWIVISVTFSLAIITVSFFSWYFLSQSQIPPYFLDKLSLIIRSNTVLIILVTLFMGLYTVLLSHRIAGPAFRIRDTIRMVLDERRLEKRVHIRENDYLLRVAEDVNRLIAQLESSNQDMTRVMLELNEIAEQLDGAESEPLARLRELIRRFVGTVTVSPEARPEES